MNLKLASDRKLAFGVDVVVADSFWRRAVGLLAHSSLQTTQALLISPCKDVHTWFMRFDIDILFLDKGNRVVSIRNRVAPFKFVLGPRGTRAVLEMAAGAAGAAGIREGDVLSFSAH